MNRLTLITTLLLFFSTIVLAHGTTTPKFNKKQKKQITKIVQGVKTGKLTKQEANKLVKQEKKLQIHKKIAKADGIVTLKERVKLYNEAKKLDLKIYKQKNDNQKRK